MDGSGNASGHISGQNINTFRLLYFISQIIGVFMIFLMVSWVFMYGGGLSWSSSPATQFNWHPLLMTIGMVFLYGNSILVYRGFRYNPKKSLKVAHATIFGIILVLVSISSLAVLDSHNLAVPPIPNFYSLHSWVGLVAATLFVFQWIGGFFSFLYPMISAPRRTQLMPFHIFFGLTGYVLAVIAAIMGLAEKAIFKLGKEYSKFPGEGILLNVIGLMFIVFGGLVVYLATHKDYKRVPLPEDSVLLSRHDDPTQGTNN